MKVLDANGVELMAPMRVERQLPRGGAGGVPGVLTWAGRQCDVTWLTKPAPSLGTYATERVSLFSRTRRCSDLTALPPSTQTEAVTAASEGARSA